MLIWLPENLYRHVKDDLAFNTIIDKMKTVWGEGDLDTFSDLDQYSDISEYQEVDRNKKQIFEQCKTELYSFFDTLDAPEHLKIIWQILCLTDHPFLDLESVIPSIEQIQVKIEDLSDNVDKIGCEIFLLEHKINYLTETTYIHTGISYFDSEIKNLRKNILDLYNSDKTYRYEENIHKIAYFNKAEEFFIENASTSSNKTNDWIKNQYEILFDSLNFYEETALRIYPTEYMGNIIDYAKTYVHTQFYNHFITSSNNENGSFVELDTWFNNNYNNIKFKYKDLNYFKLIYCWNRFCTSIGHSEYEYAMAILQEIYDVISSNLQNKNLMGKKLNYLSSGCYHNRFFAFIHSVRSLEKELLNNQTFYLNKNQFNNLTFSKNEELLIISDWNNKDWPYQTYLKEYSHSRELWMLDWDYSWMKQKIMG